MEDLGNALAGIVGADKLLQNEPMSKHTTFRIGGCARYFVMPQTVEQLQDILALCKREGFPYFVMGNGSNLLVSDEGYEGVIIQLFRDFAHIRTDGTWIYAQAGALLSAVANQACRDGLTGFEFAAGIPGTIGGAVVMNAGAYGGEMKQVVEAVTALDSDGNIRRLKADELELGYRTSVLQTRSYLALEVQLHLEKGEPKQIQAQMEELKRRRIEKQPLEYPSAGSTFKRPEGHFAGKLVMEAGFAGYQIGGAKVSEKHCGFVINAGNALAKDVVMLTDEIQKKVYQDTGVKLELEVKKLGRFS